MYFKKKSNKIYKIIDVIYKMTICICLLIVLILLIMFVKSDVISIIDTIKVYLNTIIPQQLDNLSLIEKKINLILTHIINQNEIFNKILHNIYNISEQISLNNITELLNNTNIMIESVIAANLTRISMDIHNMTYDLNIIVSKIPQ